MEREFITQGSSLEAEESSFEGLSAAPPPFQLMASGGIVQKKEKPENGFKAKKDNKWVRDIADATQKPLQYDSKADAQARAAYLESTGEWEEVKLGSEILGKKQKHFVLMRGRRTIDNFIKLIKKVEAAYPDKSTDEIIDGLRGSSKAYNDSRWKDMLGKSQTAKGLAPVKGKLSQEDLNALAAMIGHNGNREDSEKGILKDNGGDYLAMGHVLTGISAGINHNPETDLRKSTGERIGRFFGAGETVDNLYATTISGDLGQSVATLNDKGADENTRFIGEGTEATDAELLGDVDGFNIGKALSGQKENPEKLSALLAEYYASVEADEKTNRYKNFVGNSLANLKDQVQRFATNYAYKQEGKLGGLTAEIGTEVDYAMGQFYEWLLAKVEGKDKKPERKQVQTGTIRIKGKAAVLVSDPSNYSETKIASLKNGVEISIVDRGEEKYFNKEAVNKKKYGWTKVMVSKGPHEGKIGWVSNSFLDEKQK